MKIEQSSKAIHIQAPAKVNLFLEVFGKRDDGYHEVETVMCPISLFDELTFEPTEESEISLNLSLPTPLANNKSPYSISSAWDIPADSRNLVIKAVTEIRRNLGSKQGARITLKKSIPAAAGLGGGSSDAAAAVVASLIAWGKWDRELATSVCAQLGSDIPFFIGNSSRIGIGKASGRGEICEILDIQPALSFVVTHPDEGCSTSAIYAQYSKLTAEESGNGVHRSSRDILAACETGQDQRIGQLLFNALQFPATTLNSSIASQLRMFQKCDANYSLMSGSGSSCFALVSDPKVKKKILSDAVILELPRVYPVEACYFASIEHQIEHRDS